MVTTPKGFDVSVFVFSSGPRKRLARSGHVNPVRVAVVNFMHNPGAFVVVEKVLAQFDVQGRFGDDAWKENTERRL